MFARLIRHLIFKAIEVDLGSTFRIVARNFDDDSSGVISFLKKRMVLTAA